MSVFNARQPNEKALVQSEGQVRLADWLDVSWFYPEGFVRQETVETPDAYLVHGEAITYKFLKRQHGDVSGAHSWRRACNEILDNRDLAPDLYLGLRLLNWIDDQPHWSREVPGSNLRKAQPPKGAEEVVLVLRRVPLGATLAERVAEGGELDSRQAHGIAAALAHYHRPRVSGNRQSFLSGPEQLLRRVPRQRLEQVRSLAESFASFIDPFSRLALLECKAALEQLLLKRPELFFERGKKGFIGEVHGSLRAEHVCIEPLCEGGRKVSFFGRHRFDGRPALGDVLHDIAALEVDLEVRGRPRIADQLTTRYFGLFPESFDSDCLRFYSISESLLRAGEVLRYGGDEAAASSFLGCALRRALGLGAPFLAGIGGAAADGRRDLAKSLAELSGAALIDASRLNSELLAPDCPDDLAFAEICRLAAEQIRSGASVVVDWPLNRAEERMLLDRLAKTHAVSYLLVQCRAPEGSRCAEQAEPYLEQRRFSGKPHTLWVNDQFTSHLNCLILETGLGQPDLALHVLREIANT